MKNAIGEGELGAGWMDEVEEWNGDGSDGSVLLELEGAGGPVLLLFSADAWLAIVWYIRPDLDDRTRVELSGFYRGREGEMTRMRGDVQDCGFVERWVESEHEESRERGRG